MLDSQEILLPSPLFKPKPGWGGRLRIWLKRNNQSVSLVAALVIIVFATQGLIRQERGTATNDLTQTLENIITLTARQNQGISHLARQALSDYLISHRDISLTPVQELFAATALANTVPARLLSIGEPVTFQLSSLQAAIESAKNMTPYQIWYFSRLVK